MLKLLTGTVCFVAVAMFIEATIDQCGLPHENGNICGEFAVLTWSNVVDNGTYSTVHQYSTHRHYHITLICVFSLWTSSVRYMYYTGRSIVALVGFCYFLGVGSKPIKF